MYKEASYYSEYVEMQQEVNAVLEEEGIELEGSDLSEMAGGWDGTLLRRR